MYLNLTDEQLRSLCRTNIEALEKWARLMLHLVLTEKFGSDYIHAKNPDGNYKFKTKLVEKADEMIKNEPGRFPTHLDTLFLEELIYMLCHQDVYPLLSPHLKDFYPEGKEELKTFLGRVLSVRNKLSHSNPFSHRDAQRAVCYSNDFIDAVKHFFEQKNMTKEFNVPSIIKVTDSFGNEFIPTTSGEIFSVTILDPATKKPKVLYVGDKFSVTLEIDPSFADTDYRLEWTKKDGVEIVDGGKKVNVTVGNALVGENTCLVCRVISDKDWHRFGSNDHSLLLQFKALPTPTV